MGRRPDAGGMLSACALRNRARAGRAQGRRGRGGARNQAGNRAEEAPGTRRGAAAAPGAPTPGGPEAPKPPGEGGGKPGSSHRQAHRGSRAAGEETPRPQGPRGPAAPARGHPPPDREQQARRDLKRGGGPTRADDPAPARGHREGWGDPKPGTRRPGEARRAAAPPRSPRPGVPAETEARPERGKRSGKHRESSSPRARASRPGRRSPGGGCWCPWKPCCAQLCCCAGNPAALLRVCTLGCFACRGFADDSEGAAAAIRRGGTLPENVAAGRRTKVVIVYGELAAAASISCGALPCPKRSAGVVAL